jgi:N-acetylmuramoyl-L-alanine amidase
MTKTSRVRTLTALLLALALLLVPSLSINAAQETDDSSGILQRVTDRNVTHYERLTVKIGRARLAMQGLLIRGQAYLPLYELADAFVACQMTKVGSKYTLTADGLSATAVDGQYHMEVNGRYFYFIYPIVAMSDGELYVPMRNAAKTLGISATYDATAKTVSLSGSYTPPVAGSLWYSDDAVYWLSRIISAESRGEPLLGQIAVGCVVLNRVRSSAYPNTIWGVIFDRKNGTQFSPVANGTIYQTPTALSVIAAKICLEGYSVSSEILFFLEPRLSVSTWVPSNRPYRFTIGHHDFYA